MSADEIQFSDSDLTSLLSDAESGAPASKTASPGPVVVESLVAGRARRANAGNLLANLLTQEADEEDTLFLEDEDDVEFEVKEKDLLNDDDDALMEDSEDEDYDAGPPPPGGDDEDLEGEKELERQEKELQRARKRKADDAYLKPRPRGKIGEVRRRVTIAEGAEEGGNELPVDEDGYTALTRPRKKSERISWVPEFVATRASSRTLSLQNRSETLRRLEESERRRLHTIALMEKAAKKKQKVRPKKEMTQEERLEEAKLTERRNLRSLCSWEETEKQKLEEQRQRLAALQNRKLAGPVITYWSGTAEWSGVTGRLVKIGKGKMMQEIEDGGSEEVKKKKKIRKPKGKDADKENHGAKGEGKNDSIDKEKAKADVEGTSKAIESPTKATESSPQSPLEPNPPNPASAPESKQGLSVSMEGILDYAALPPGQLAPTPQSVSPQPGPQPQPEPQPQSEPEPEPALASASQEALPLPKPNETSARNLIMLENFDAFSIKDRASLVKTLMGEQPKRLPTAKPYCVISHQPAKFRDPATGMPFASLHAYREIKRLLHGEIRWSYMLDAYVGEAGMVAKGVPDGF